jgi:hypothetical protein
MLSKYYYRLLTPQSQRNDRPDEDIPLRTEKALDAISNARRRAVIIEVAGRGTPVTLSTLSETIAADELETNADALTAQDRKRVYISLYQTHLPKLTDLGAVSYNERDGIVGASDATAPLVELIHEIEDRSLTVK